MSHYHNSGKIGVTKLISPNLFIVVFVIAASVKCQTSENKLYKVATLAGDIYGTKEVSKAAGATVYYQFLGKRNFEIN